MDEEQRNKSHKQRAAGNKATRKDEVRKTRKGLDLQPNRGMNPKAFVGRSALSHKSTAAVRSLEKRENILHLPSMDQSLVDVTHSEAPMLVAVVGPKGCGKTTLIRSLIKFYSGRNLHRLRGPVTVIAGKTKRITFMECPNTLASMCDISKVADLVLLMVDGNFGFEMDTFEFLNISQTHGFPKMIGVVSHLDLLKQNKALKKRKKFLRHRFWHEVAEGAKLICLSPMQNALYRQTDILKLHRLLICVEPKIQQWRQTHSAVLSDRFEDLTDPTISAKTPNVDRTIAFFGYMRGKPLKANQMVHIPGLGDYSIQHVSVAEDPCQLPDGANSLKSQGHKMRHLSVKQKRLFAPYCDVGGLLMDDDGIYVKEDADRANVERTGEGLQLLRELQRVEATVDERENKLDIIQLSSSSAEDRRPVKFTSEDGFELKVDVQLPAKKKHTLKGPLFEHKDKKAGDESSSSDDDDSTVASDGVPSYRGSQSVDAKKQEDAELHDFFGIEKSVLPGEGIKEEGNDGYDEQLAPLAPHAADSIRILTLRHDWSELNQAALYAAAKNLCVTGYKNTTSVGDTKQIGEEEVQREDSSDKGYDSQDDEFEQATTTKMGNGVLLEAKKKRQRTSISAEVSEEDQQPVSLFLSKKMSKQTKNRLKKSTQEGTQEKEEYDILKDNDELRNTPAQGITHDPLMNDLVNHFLAKKGTSSQQEIDFDATAKEVDERSGDSSNEEVGEDGSPLGQQNKDALASVTLGHSATRKKQVMNPQDDDKSSEYLAKKFAKKKQFDDGYDVDGGKNNTTGYYKHLQDETNIKKQQFQEVLDIVGDSNEKKVALLGFYAGLYVRIAIQGVPHEFVKNFNPNVPLIVGGLNAGEDQLQMVHAKIKRHRWFPKILKAQDPIVISIGWRRIQTQPIFASEDPNGRLRYLKYTPLHMHCFAAFYAPITPPNTGFIAIPVAEVRSSHFRCTCTGYTIGNDTCTAVVKKLKLTGTPSKVQKTTCFVKGMFNSDIEAAKFVGAKVKSVSGLRGIIKAVMKGKQGLVRCTFEDKLPLSDIVFLRAWKPVDPPPYCAPVPNLLAPLWVGMRPMAVLRREHNMQVQPNPDSEYREKPRVRRTYLKEEPVNVVLSRNDRMKLPFDMKEEYIPIKRTSEVQERIVATTTIAPEPHEMKAQALLDVFQEKAAAMEAKKREAKMAVRAKQARDRQEDSVEYARKLKKAKKETARKTEFRSQHKSRASATKKKPRTEAGTKK